MSHFPWILEIEMCKRRDKNALRETVTYECVSGSDELGVIVLSTQAVGA